MTRLGDRLMTIHKPIPLDGVDGLVGWIKQSFGDAYIVQEGPDFVVYAKGDDQ